MAGSKPGTFDFSFAPAIHVLSEQGSAGMLVLTRKMNEEIKIGDQVVVKILGVRGQCVRVGIEAPRNIRVMRTELVNTEPERAIESTVGGEEGLSAAVSSDGTCTAVTTISEPKSTGSAAELPCAARTCQGVRPASGRSTLAALLSRRKASASA